MPNTDPVEPTSNKPSSEWTHEDGFEHGRRMATNLVPLTEHEVAWALNVLWPDQGPEDGIVLERDSDF
jgi:hypothetical protein